MKKLEVNRAVSVTALAALTPAPWNPRSSKDERFQNDGSRGGRNFYEVGPTELACDPASHPVRVLADRIPMGSWRSGSEVRS